MPTILTLPFKDCSSTEEEISTALSILNLFKELNPHLTGFSNHCWAAAYALNQVLFDNKCSIIAAFNQQAYLKANRSIGHVAVHYLTDDEGCDFVDMDGFKDSSSIESWGMLAPDDSDYISLFELHHIPVEDTSFENVIWIKYSSEEIESLVDNKLLSQYVDGLKQAKQLLQKQSYNINTNLNKSLKF